MYIDTIHNLFLSAERGVCKIMTKLAFQRLLAADESPHLYLDDLEVDDSRV